MMKQHKELLDAIGAAEAKAKALRKSGAKIDGVISQLRSAAAEIETRISYLKRQANPKPKAVEEAGSPAPPPPPAEP